MTRMTRTLTALAAAAITSSTLLAGTTTTAHAAPDNGERACSYNPAEMRQAAHRGTVRVNGKRATFTKNPGVLRAVVEYRNGDKIRLRPLCQEDGDRGYWLGDVHGDGVGLSFIALRDRPYYIR